MHVDGGFFGFIGNGIKRDIRSILPSGDNDFAHVFQFMDPVQYQFTKMLDSRFSELLWL